MKENAKEYLLEFAKSQDKWMKALIYDSIKTNGDIKKERVEEIYKALSLNKDIDFMEPITPILNNDKDNDFYISKLEHKKGVAALQPNQTFKFRKNINIIYGLNGSGKSSYFKILNEIVGGNQEKEVISNIYLDEPQRIDVKVSYTEKDREKITNWGGEKRAIEPLNHSRVFDTSYLNGLLSTREADKTILEPLNLNLFSYIVLKMQSFKSKLNEEAEIIRSEKPIIENGLLRDEFKNFFSEHKVNDQVRENMLPLYNFDDYKKIQLAQLEKDVKELNQTNFDDKIKLESQKREKFFGLKKRILSVSKTLKDFESQSKNLISTYSERKGANENAIKTFVILKDIPNVESSEWKSFISMGETYSKTIDNHDICPYCRQPLSEKGIKLIEAYGKFLVDKTEIELKQSQRDLKSITEKIKKTNFEIELENGEVKEILQQTKLKSQTLFDRIKLFFLKCSKYSETLIEVLEMKNVDLLKEMGECEELIASLDNLIDNSEEEIKAYEDQNKQKQKIIAEKESELFDLKENQFISKNQKDIDEWFIKNNFENDLRDKSENLKTRRISSLSKRAHQALITENLKDKFKEELTGLGYKNLDVQIEPKNAHKGNFNTQLTLSKKNSISEILSEGEQKAVALALFIAEIRMQNNHIPVILDDPVNSLDHNISYNFAIRLMKLENQIIIFTHTKLFLDAFETSKTNHVCKTITTDCNDKKGKHIVIYKISSDGRNRKGVVSEYKSNDAKTNIRIAENELKRSNFIESNVSSSIRKAVECTIDEIVFNRQIPTKYGNKNSRINWESLKKLNNDHLMIDELKTIHDRVSGGSLHNGTESEMNPIGKEEFENLINKLKDIISLYRNSAS